MTLEDALRSDLLTGPSPAAALAIDQRVFAALAEQASPTVRLRRFATPPIVAVLGTLVLGAAIAIAAFALTSEDQRVVDLTACMQGRGWDVDPVDLAGGTGHVVPGFPTVVDGSQQEAFNADLAACATNAGIPVDR